MPELGNTEYLTTAGFDHRATLLIQSRLGGRRSISAETLSDALVPWMDDRAWREVSDALEDVMFDPSHHPFTYDSLCNDKSPWSRVAMGLLGSPHVRPTGYVQMMASAAGLRRLIEVICSIFLCTILILLLIILIC